MRTIRKILIAQMLLGAMAFSIGAQSASQTAPTPRIENAKLETRAVAGSLDATLRGIAAQAEKPLWVGYAVDQIPGERSVCCGNYRDDAGCGTCNLEKDHDGNTSTTQKSGTVALEAPRQLFVLFRLEARQVMRIRVASADCTLDAGGLPFLWLTGVKPAESVALLETYVHGADFEGRSHRHCSPRRPLSRPRIRILHQARSKRIASSPSRLLDGRGARQIRLLGFTANGKN
jgi:hypothetical protein